MLYSFEGHLSRDAPPAGPKRTLASVGSAYFPSVGSSVESFASSPLNAESFKLTLACALDLAALENIPSLSFRIV